MEKRIIIAAKGDLSSKVIMTKSNEPICNEDKMKSCVCKIQEKYNKQ